MANVSGADAQGAAEAAIKAATNELISGAVKVSQHDAAKLDAMMGIGVFLTAEELFAYAEHQLQKADGDIHAMMADVSVRRDKASALGKLAAAVRALKEAPTATEQSDALKKLVDQAKLDGLPQEAIDAVTTLQASAEHKIKSSGDSPLEKNTVEDQLKMVDEKAQEMTSSVDLSMIKLQSLIQQRNQALTFVSNAMAAMNEPAKNAISNMRGG
jgi:hypothetical protein